MNKSTLKTICMAVLVSFTFVTVMSCAAPQTERDRMRSGGAVLGAVGGAVAGALLGDFKGALWGAGIGAVVGGIAGDQVGNYMEKQQQEFDQALAREREASVRREGQILVATYKADMLFSFDSAEIKPGAYPSLDKTARILKEYDQTRIQIEGHTDNVGSEKYNMDLSLRRADAVAQYLVSQGVNSDRIRTVGFGETEPVADNSTAWGRAQNRRVEMHLEPIVANG